MRKLAQLVEKTPEPCKRGQEILVQEPNIRPWRGTVLSMKWSPVSGWWIDVRREDGGWWIVHEGAVR